MKTLFLNIFAIAVFLFTSAPAPAAGERLVMVAPFDNLSDVRRYINYEVDTGAVTGNPRKQYRVDRYCHVSREVLEDTVSTFPGFRPVERAQFDRVMLEVSGAVRDGAVDPEKAKFIAVKLGADAILMGTILDLRQATSTYAGYAHLTETIYRAELRVRLINLTTTKGSSRILADVVSSYRVRGVYSTAATPYLQSSTSDPYFLAISDALAKLEFDESFKAKFSFQPAAALERVPVHFELTPTNSSVYAERTNGWQYLGGTPFTDFLPTGVGFRIRVEKTGHQTWESYIEPKSELRVTHELPPQNSIP